VRSDNKGIEREFGNYDLTFIVTDAALICHLLLFNIVLLHLYSLKNL